MKALVICPGERSEVSALAETQPLICQSICGKPFIDHWLEHLATKGAKEIQILAVDRPECVRSCVGDGAKWGIKIEVLPQLQEFTPEEGRSRFCAKPEEWLGADAVTLIDHVPGKPGEKLFESYSAFFSAASEWITRAATPDRIGVRQVAPNVWVGLRSRISSSARLVGPCWIGDNVSIGPDATIGPNVLVENHVMIERGVEASNALIGSETFAGEFIQISDSLAFGNRLVNWRTDSITQVRDPFLLSSLGLGPRPTHRPTWMGRVAAALALALLSPVIGLTLLRAVMRGHRAFRPRRAVGPSHAGNWTGTITYYEQAGLAGWWRRWPQLWNIVQGEFCWVGNRPLSPFEAGKLQNEFERLWLAAPIGLVSLADAEGCREYFSDESKVHSAFFAVHANWKMRFNIFIRALYRLTISPSPKLQPAPLTAEKGKSFSLGSSIVQ